MSITVPYVPSPPEVVEKMLELAKVTSNDVVYDLGCGDGRLLITAIKKFGVKKAVGYEIRKDLYDDLVRRIEKENLSSRIFVYNEDLLNAELSEATVVTLFLTTSANEKIKPKLEAELKPGARIVSHEFTFKDWIPQKVETLSWHKIYLYVIPYCNNSKNRFLKRL
ncbi:MAG: rRNA adenine N-6-methyltransferase family protein [Nitrososphaerota archaeon]|nr:rRNA adenine N-6-methyltransferase family protein [Nitrososphaerota archaeon]